MQTQIFYSLCLHLQRKGSIHVFSLGGGMAYAGHMFAWNWWNDASAAPGTDCADGEI